jgi:hypothetical protein
LAGQDTIDLNKVELANDDPLLKHHSPLFQIVRDDPLTPCHTTQHAVGVSAYCVI